MPVTSLYLGPGAVLPALEQTVPVAGLSGLRFAGVTTGAGLHPVALPLHQAVLHALDVQTAVARAALSGAFALSGDVPPCGIGGVNICL